jgi:AcrR family transcriptional regulator
VTNKTDQLAPRRKPSQDRSRDRVERILDATAALLGDTPVDKITTAAIAEEAGVPIGSVYQYFPNKLAVLAELARRVMEQVDLKTTSLIAEDFGVLPWDQAIDRAIDATMQGFAEQPGYLQLLLSIRPTPEFRSMTVSSSSRAPPFKRRILCRTGRCPQTIPNWPIASSGR